MKCGWPVGVGVGGWLLEMEIVLRGKKNGFEPSRSKKGDFTVEKYFEIIRSIYSLASLESNPLLFKIF
jgi:hypothetical protein